MPSSDLNMQPLVLIADDDEMMRSLISASLRERGFETVEVGNGRDAVTLIGRITPDLVILDVQMPVLDGFAACAEIRAGDRGHDIPIVIVTGTDDTLSIERAFEVGATDFISKPVNWSLLGHRMRYVIRGAETRRALGEREAENSALLEALPDRIVLLQQSGEIVKLLEHRNPTQDTQRDYAGESIDVLLPHDAHLPAKKALHDVLTSQSESSFEFRASGERAKDKRHYEARVVPHTHNVALMIIRDVTERKASEARIHQLAYYDTLTKLPNRHHFMEAINNTLAGEPQNEFALFSLDLDQFKRINDTLGHTTGDTVLIETAQRLLTIKQRLRKSGCYAEVARLSGDEFIFTASLRSEKHLQEIMQMMDKAFKAPIESHQQQLFITISAGIATYPEDGSSIQTLLKKAAQALTTSKQAGGNTYSLYRYIKQESPLEDLKLEFELRGAIENSGLELYFQPKYDLANGAMCGAEALLRWFHPERGLISPAVFIPMAERSGLIIDIDRWVSERTCRHLSEWQNAGHQVLPVSINLSGHSFSYDRPAKAIASAMATYNVDPDLLEVEITETVLMADAAQAIRTLEELKNMGIKLSIDDFGTGYSSLSYLKRFPLDALKIDRAFIMDLETDSNDQALCNAVISMAHSLGLQVVAEGVETDYQRQFLVDAGCELAQGFLLDKPMNAQDFAAKIAQAPADNISRPSAQDNKLSPH